MRLGFTGIGNPWSMAAGSRIISNEELSMILLKRMVNGITDENIWKRISWMYASFFILLLSVMILSYFLLPDGFMRGKHPFTGFQLSSGLWVSTLQIFAYNLIFTLLTISANLFARKSRVCPENFKPLGYLAFWGVTMTTAIYMGTWSQEIVTSAPSLPHRFLRFLDIIHQGGLWELSGYLLAATASFRFTHMYTNGKNDVARRNWRDVFLTTPEKVLFTFAFILLLRGAYIESNGIVQVKGLLPYDLSYHP
jgi:hypothetical protein